jgi:hypothetical protein
MLVSLKEVPPHTHAAQDRSSDVTQLSQPPLDCRSYLLRDKLYGSMTSIHSLATHVGMIPAVINSLKLGDEQRVINVLMASAQLVVWAARDQVTDTAGRLLPAIAGLITASPPVAPGLAADALFGLGFMRRELIKDYHKWGMGTGLQRLTEHSDPYTAAAGKRLLFLVTQGLDVSRLLLLNVHAMLCYLPSYAFKAMGYEGTESGSC